MTWTLDAWPNLRSFSPCSRRMKRVDGFGLGVKRHSFDDGNIGAAGLEIHT